MISSHIEKTKAVSAASPSKKAYINLYAALSDYCQDSPAGIVIENFEPATFQALLDYLHSGTCEIKVCGLRLRAQSYV
jgi:hypothetical protein